MISEMQGFRLSPQQKHLWHLQENDNFSYCSQCAVLIEGNLDLDILRLALEQVVNRHEILHTNFYCLPGMTIPLQVIRNKDITWNENYDLNTYTPQEKEEFLSTLFDEVNKKPFDLVEGSSLYVSLVTLSSSQYALVISLPALCADGTTLKILVQEISQSYAACLQGKELNNEPLQYADLAEWQNELLEGADTEAGRDYWRKQDFSTLTKLKLPFEKQFLEQLEFKPQTQSFTVTPALREQIDTLTQQYNTSMAEFFLACWQILLMRLTKQQNFSIGVAYEGRKYQELEKSLGLFGKYLPLNLNVELESNFIDVLHKNNECAKQLYKLQDYFTWESISESYPKNLRFFPVCFDWEELLENSVAANVSFSIYQLYSCIERFNLKLSCTLQNDALSVALHYDSNLFHVEDIKRLVGQFQTLLASAIAHSDTAISQLEILSQIERQQLLDLVNNTKRDYPQNKCIHHLFEEQARKTPNKVAVIFEDQQLTYHEINQRANKIAHYLQKQGVAPEVLVGVCVERSLEMIVGLLAILKAGGAYVPLDPALPKEGLALRLQDLRVSLVISHSSLVNNFEPMANNFEQITVIYLDSDWETIAQENEVNLNTEVTSENLVYTLFTSGSTGRPKGVAIEHQQLLNYLYAIIDRLNLPAGTNFALVSTFAADLGNTVIFPSLCTGGCLHVISYERATDPAALAEYCHRHPIDCLKIVPSHLASLLTSSSPKSILPQKRLILGGEATSWELIEQIQRYAQDCQIFNHYGPTEATVGVLTYLVELNDDLSYNQKSKTVPLGRSIPNTQVYVLEENLQPVPIGVSGEIYIGGITLARCYLNQPQQTAVKFIPNPFSQEEGTRLYKTGDQARYLPDGTIEFLGRIDHQVKIRGFRVELGEIEAVLSLHPNVREVVVSARDSESGQNYLAAYVVPSQESPILINELRNYMQARLPEYMVPSTFVILKALPLTPNGKVDRQALPVPNQVRPELETSFTTPRTPAEEVLAGIWARVLGTEHVGIHDNFFDLGGHSLLATQVVSQIREAFQVELRLRSLFETPTVAGLAELIETVVRAGQKLELPPIENVSRDRELPLSFAQQRLWFLDQLEPGNPFYNICRGLILKGSLNVAALEQTLNEIVRRHEVLRTNFGDVNGRPVQKIASALNITLPIIDLGELLEEQEVEVRRLARSQARQSFNLTQDVLLGTTLLRLQEEEHVLVFTIHHIVADGWSTGVIIQEITALYESFCSGNPSSLPELPIQYADFAIWQRQWLQTVQSSQMTYWKQQLGGNLPVLQLPTDRPRPAIQTFRGRKQRWQISKALTEALKSLSQRETVTLFMTLLAAFKTLLYRYTNQADILIGSPIANRNRTSKIEDLIGFFVNTLVLRTDLSGNPSFKELLQRVRQVTLDAYAHQDLPFEQLVEELQPERNLSYTPLFQVMLVLHNVPVEVLKLSDLILSPMEVEPETALFDLTVYLTETKQGMMGYFEYNSDLFDTATIERMQGHFQTLLEGIVANPDQHLFDLPILSATEQQQLLLNWNKTSADYSSTCIHQLFEAQVEQTPNAIAVVFEDQQLTYQELNFRANQLAHYLRSLGVGPEVLVGICTERSLHMVVGLLGILKAGGAYVPLDPSYPQERLAFMIEDSQPRVFLTQQHLVKSLPVHQARVVCIDSNWELIASERIENPRINITVDNLAYVIYTSGSTGKPKGAMNAHRGICNRLLWMQEAYQLTSIDKVLQKTPFSFDVSVWEFFWPLMMGASLVVAQPEGHRDPNYLVNLIIQEQISTLHFVPSMLGVFLEVENLETCKCLKRVMASGEALPAQLQKRFFNRLSAQLHNLYGPTEAAVDVTYWACGQQSNPEQNNITHEKTVPIGHPIANIQIYLLDQYLNPVPVGITSEVYIGGVGVGRGYLNRPELTAERFIPNPFSDKSASRLYKTGDLARYLPNGEIEYIGRIDHQVKVRGYRIELGEIEALLNQHPALQHAVVLAQEDQPGNKRLVAYVVQNLQSQSLEKLVSDTAWQNENISQWEVVFDQSYADISEYQDPTFNISSWNSSYTNLPLPAAEMREWVDYTVERILALQPSRVLEIGCGTGLLLFRIAPHCTQYWGTDISSVALNQIQQQLNLQEQKLTQVKLFEKRAENFENVEAEAFDMVILNSVVQYFPTITYLLQVLEGAVKAVEPGGFIFVGDVRSLPLLEAFHASVGLHQASVSLSKTQLQQRVQKGIAQERELVVDPALFIALKQHFPQITHVQIQLKRGHYYNELTKFRYDVILHIGDSSVYSTPELCWLDWQEQRLTLSSVRQLLEETAPKVLGIVRVPNSRVLTDIKTVELLESDSELDTVGDIAKALQKIVPTAGVDPEDLWGLCEDLPYTIDLNCSVSGVNGSYDALFKRRTIKTLVSFPGETVPLKPWNSYTNNPLQGKFASELVPQLRTFLKPKLPDYMLPAAFVMLTALPLTPNGKVDRKALPTPDQIRPELEKVFIAPQTIGEKQLAVIWAQVLGLEKVGINDNFFELGGDSILSLQIISKANQVGLHLTPKHLFQHQTIAQLAAVADTTKIIQAEQGAVTGKLPLTPIQQWFFEQEQPEPHHWNQAVLLEVKQSTESVVLEQVIQSLLRHHDALRLRFLQEEVGTQAVIVSYDDVVPITYLDLSALPKEEQITAIGEMAAELQASLNLSVGPLFRVAIFDLGDDKPSRLLWVIHHLVVDGVSWRILIDDLQTGYQQLCEGKEIQLPPKTTSFKQWSHLLLKYAQSSVLAKELDYWLLSERQAVKPIPKDYQLGNNTQATACTVSVSLCVEETQVLLQQVPVAYRTQINDILLTALTQTFAQWTGESSLLIDLEGHGREELFEDVDLSRTVGWFTSIFPVHLSLENATSQEKALMAIKEQLRAIPNRGIGYGVLCYLTQNQEITSQLNSLPKAEVMFNYLGQLDQVFSESSLFSLAQESSGLSHSLQSKRVHLLEINSSISQGRLQMNWTYSQNLHRQTTVEVLAQGFIEALRSLIIHCQFPEAGSFTPSDFPDVELSQEKLESALAEIDFS